MLAAALEAARELGLSLRHRILIVLAVNGGEVGVSMLARLLGRSSTEVAEILGRMKRDGLVEYCGDGLAVRLSERGWCELAELLESLEGRGRVLRVSVLYHACRGRSVKETARVLGVTPQQVYRVTTVRVRDGRLEPRYPRLCTALETLADILKRFIHM